MGLAGGFGLMLGLLEDASSGLAFGANAVALSLVGALGARTRELFVGDSRSFAFSYVFLGKWLKDLLHWIAVGETVREPFLNAVLLEGFLAALYAGVCGGILMLLGREREEAKR
jgi:hypothetical protein